MTEISKMTDQQLNRALAELMGSNGDRTAIWIPCTDPAASLEVQTAACAKDKVQYIENLCKVTDAGKIEEGYWMWDQISFLLNATPRQRAEAAYMTLSQ